MKRHSERPLVRTREAAPGLRQGSKGAELTCPFCTPTHVLLPDKPASCGTLVQVKAVQVVVPRHTAKQKQIKCLKCGQVAAGEMVQYMNGYICLEECAPETKLMAEPPKFSKLAEIVFKLPEWARKKIEPRLGSAKQVQEIDPDGNLTGKILGHFFYKGV